MKNDHLGSRMEHAANIGSDGITDVVEGAVVPLRVTGISEGLRCRLGLSQEKTETQKQGESE